MVAEYNFDAWGRRRSADDWSYTLDANDLDLFADRGFTGHACPEHGRREYLKYFNLYNLNGRMYDPLVGRFLSPDPFVQDPTSTQSMNRYSYCLNNPLKYTDPTGMTYFKLNSNWEWESFEYNPFMGGEQNFRIASGGGITPERLNGTYRYNSNTEGYENNIGERVTWNEVNAKYVAPKSSLFTIQYGVYFGEGNGVGGLTIKLGYKDGGTGLTNFNFVQTISTNVPLGGASSPYNDPQPPDDNLPFYWTNAELTSFSNRDGYDVIFQDRPTREMKNGTSWRAELSVVGMNSSGAYVPIYTISYGFRMNSYGVTLYPITYITPSTFHRNSF